MKQNWNWQSWWKPTLAVATFIGMFEWAFHWVLLKDMYAETASLWRTHAEMLDKTWLMVGALLLFSAWLVWLYPKGYEGKSKWEGARFGLWMGMLFSVMVASWYAILPIPATLAWAWVAGTLIECIGAGAVIGWTWKPAK